MSERWMVGIIIGLTVVGVSAFTLWRYDPAPARPSQPKADPASQVACTHFYNVIGDVEDEILTDREIRTKLREVYATAKLSEERGIASGAQAMLAGATANDADRLREGAGEFRAGCRAIAP